MSETPRSLVDMLRRRSERSPDTVAYTFLADGEAETDWLTYGTLDRRARAIAAALVEDGVGRGDRAILLYPPGLDFIAAFFGTLYAGVVAVPCYPPQPTQLARGLPRLIAVVGDAQASAVLCPSAVADLAPGVAPHAPALAALRWIATDLLDEGLAGSWREPDADPSTLAFLQYTSGSTAAPRGVMVSHGNLLHNLAYGNHVEENDETSRSVSWLPVIHDMGLIEGVLQPAYAGYPAYLMAPTAFLQRPMRWLRAISRYRATNSGGPNFAYDLCVRKVAAGERAELDLSGWRVAYNGAEPIRADTLVAFHDAFAARGFRWNSFYPVYGLAEGTLVVSSGRRAYEPVVHEVDAAALAEGFVRPADADGAHGPSRTMVSSGPPSFGTEVVIVDPDLHTPKGPREIGEVWVASPSVAQGYWRRPDDTRQVFRATLRGGDDGRTYLRTGDLGVLIDGELVIVGRCKDMLIVRGMKYAPQDLELTAERQHGAIRRGCVAAFAVSGGREEAVVLAAEIDPRRLDDGHQDEGGNAHAEPTIAPPIFADLAARIHRAIADDHGIQLHAVVLLGPGGVARTTSGKIRRHACADAFARGELGDLYRWNHGADGRVASGRSFAEARS